MSGRRRDEGQLALMDAMVFFVASIAVTVVLLSFAAEVQETADIDGSYGFDAEKILRVFLGASLGHDTEVFPGGVGLLLSQREIVADCLLLEAHSIAEGDDSSGFRQLDLRFIEILRSICGLFAEPSLRLVDVSDETPVVLSSIPSEWVDVEVACAASAEIADAVGGSYLVQFRSVPSSGVEL